MDETEHSLHAAPATSTSGPCPATRTIQISWITGIEAYTALSPDPATPLKLLFT